MNKNKKEWNEISINDITNNIKEKINQFAKWLADKTSKGE